MGKKKTKEEFIKEATEKHKDKYDYSKVDYVNSKTKVCINCPEHGEFWQIPNSHLKGCGCHKCANETNGERFRLSKEEFIEKARKQHGDKYDYSKVKYVNGGSKICIICPKSEHDEFLQIPSSHLSGRGCPKCANEAKREKLTPSKEDFIKKARKVHGDKYDYSKVEYVNSKTKVCIICSEHGDFWQTPNDHLGVHSCGCPKCSNETNGERCSLSKEEFIKKANEVHKGKYNYDKVEYDGNKTKVCIICAEHGEFWQKPNGHLSGQGCPKCGIENRTEKRTSTKEEFIKKATEKHGDKYDYSKVVYVNNKTKVCIICPESEHGEFWQTPSAHANGHGCHKCKDDKTRERLTSTKEEFIKMANEVHGNKYDYHNVEYVNNKTKVCIICPEHGEFKQKPNGHLSGAGCPKCNLSHLERSVMNYLDEHEIAYDYQKRFNWLGRQSLDFYLPYYNVGIECQGRQHFEEIDYFGGDNGLIECKKRDKRKFKKCQKHGIKVLYYSNLGIEYPYDVFEDLDLLFKEIKN